MDLLGGEKPSFAPTLERVRILLEHFGNPQNDLKYVHIAGTNGKGSVSLKTAMALEKAGKKVGLFTSPHLTCFRERILINREMIPQDKCTQELKRIMKAVKENKFDVITFEIIFCLALLYFKEQNVDYVVLECGIGGKWDTTNIIEKNEVAAITSVGLDHMEYLGDTLDKIATDKAGIAREGIPFICGRVVPHETVRKIIEEAGGLFILAT